MTVQAEPGMPEGLAERRGIVSPRLGRAEGELLQPAARGDRRRGPPLTPARTSGAQGRGERNPQSSGKTHQL